jgi:hypothetical protein
MVYTPHLPPLIAEMDALPDATLGSPIFKKAVTPVTSLLQMTLKEFEQGGLVAQVRVHWLPQTLWFVPGEKEAGTIVGRGISRGRIWTARELTLLWSTRIRTCQELQTVAGIKSELNGEVVTVEESLDCQEKHNGKECTKG